MGRWRTVLLVLGLLCGLRPAVAAEARLLVDGGDGVQAYDRAELLARPDLEIREFPDDPVYHGRLGPVPALRLDHLLSPLPAGAILQAVAADGFAAQLAAERLFGGDAEPYLAIEPPDRPWPPLSADSAASAGPFYLVWRHAAAGGIGSEEWPYQIVRLTRLKPVAERFPALRPDPALPPSDPVRQGFALFQRTCFACHPLNGQGDGTVGPDLNIPFNPTEYLQPGMLETLVRNPQSLRRWPQARMPAFDEAALSRQDLAAVIAYLRHMAGRKAP